MIAALVPNQPNAFPDLVIAGLRAQQCSQIVTFRRKQAGVQLPGS